jgi:hypothetical protein
MSAEIHRTQADIIESLNSLDSTTIHSKIDQLDQRRKGLLVLLRAAQARERAAARRTSRLTKPKEVTRA